MGNVQSEPSAGGGSRKEQASDRSSDSRRTSLVEPEVTPSSPAMRLARGLGVWFPGSSAPPGLLVPPEPQASPSPLPLTLELPSPVTPPSEEAAAAAVSTPPPPPVGTLLPAPSKWRKPTGTPVPRIRGLLEASHRGQGDPPSLRPLPPPSRQLTEEDPDPVPRAPSPTPPPLEPRKPPLPPPSDRQPPDRRITPTLATPAATPTESQARLGSEGQTASGARRGAPPQAGEGEMARPAASEPGLSLLCKVTFKSGPPLPPAAASSSLAAKASFGGGGGGGGGLFAASGVISYAEVLKQGPLAPGASRPSGEVPRGTQEAEGGDGDGEGCSGPPSAPASHARTLPPPPYTTFPGSKPKFDWVSPPEGPERHFRFNGAGGGVGAPRRRAAAFSGPWGSAPPAPGQMHPAPGTRRSAPALLAPPMFIFPAPTNGEPVRPGPPGPPELPPPPPPPPPPTPPPTPPPAPPPTPQPPVLQPTPLPVTLPPAPGPGHSESAVTPAPAPVPAPALSSALAADQAPAPAPAPAPSPAPAPTVDEPLPPAPAPVKTRTRRNKGPRAARAVPREDGAPGDGPRERTATTVTDSRGAGGGGSGALPAGTANSGTARHWPPFQVLNSCPCKCYCRHQPRHRRLPRNVSAWLSTPTNHLSEPPWVATIKLAGSLVAGLEHYDLQATHSN
ncbi:gametogenetin [Cervus elaphus]|uniref:gametogenetin n=1 Tax=Cervus elaphus TaxID=9860 RepID=UPI001CC300CF|nr:gametogenetin [Cervus elaphus]XP_043750837.1 gametogenetin [Cervus elaphus]XP_043750844.1 gametogenetin [Cervus elaphus]XP_043750852.1 gametogenetin [Cervus elaphus]